MDRTVKGSRLMMPGEAQAYQAFTKTKEVVEDVATRRLGFKPDQGFRPMTARERVAEFDGLSPEQRNALIDKMGMQWYVSQAEEVQQLRDALAEIPPMPAGFGQAGAP